MRDPLDAYKLVAAIDRDKRLIHPGCQIQAAGARTNHFDLAREAPNPPERDYLIDHRSRRP